ncbi:hypothetical protein H8E88_00960 [candidate division KSB1 bacterium]|nr:hypothetical protein [candidate division KSB1 bacterium]
MDPNSLMPKINPSWLAGYKDLLLILAGGFCAAFGGFFSTWYQAKKARKIKMEETIGQQKVDVYKKALRLVDQLSSELIQGTSQDVLNLIKEENQFVLDNEILLPHKFAQYWHSVRANIRTAKRREISQGSMSDGIKSDKQIEEIVGIEDFARGLAKAAKEEIRKELGLPTFNIIRPPKQKESNK